MSKWFTTPATTPRFQYPNEIFVRFVARNYYPVRDRTMLRFLEIGSGSGGDLKFLREQGFSATGIDPALEAVCDFNETAAEYLGQPDRPDFDCIYELNVLCHVEEPPYHAIAEALKLGGKFFAIMPADDTEADLEGKGFTRLSSPWSIRQNLDGIFSKIDIRPSCYPHRQRNHVNWVVEADK